MKYPLLRTGAFMVLLSATSLTAQPLPATLTASPALKRLIDGNARYQKEAATHPRQDRARRDATATGQQPFAMVLSCADSRVPVETLFDQGIGDLFVVRVAGNIADVNETASIEYGAKHLGARLCVVMGHTDCGAVKAAVAGLKFDDNIANLMVELAPAVERTRHEQPDLQGDKLLRAAIETNVRYSMETLLRRSEVLREAVRSGKLELVGAIYDVATGKVQWLGQHPDQARLVAAQ